MRWLRSALDLLADIAAALLLEVGALVDEWRGEGR